MWKVRKGSADAVGQFDEETVEISLRGPTCTIASKIKLTRVILESCRKYSHSLSCCPGRLRLTGPVPPVSPSQPGRQRRQCEYSRQLSRMTRVNLILETIVHKRVKIPLTHDCVKQLANASLSTSRNLARSVLPLLRQEKGGCTYGCAPLIRRVKLIAIWFISIQQLLAECVQPFPRSGKWVLTCTNTQKHSLDLSLNGFPREAVRSPYSNI